MLDGIGQLSAGGTQLAAGSESLKQGVQAYTAGTAQLDAGLGKLQSELGGSVGQASKLPEAIQSLTDGAGQLIQEQKL